MNNGGDKERKEITHIHKGDSNPKGEMDLIFFLGKTRGEQGQDGNGEIAG